MPRRRSLLGHLTNSGANAEQLKRQADTRRRLLNVQRAPVRQEIIVVTPEEAKRKRRRLRQSFYAGPAPVGGGGGGNPFLLYGLRSIDLGEPDFYVRGEFWQYLGEGGDNGWTLIGIISEVPDTSVDALSVRGDKGFVYDSNQVTGSFVSSDGGETWGENPLEPSIEATAIANDGRLIAILGESGDEDIAYSDNDGASWTIVDAIPVGSSTGRGWGVARTNPEVPGVVVLPYDWSFAGGIREVRVAVSTDNGESYTHHSISTHTANILGSTDAHILDSGRILVSWSQESLYLKSAYSDDNGVTWSSPVTVYTKSGAETQPLNLRYVSIGSRVFAFPRINNFVGAFAISDDNGETFSPFTHLAPHGQGTGDAARYGTTDVAVVQFVNGFGQQVHLLRDAATVEAGSEDWVDITPSGANIYDIAATVAAQ